MTKTLGLGILSLLTLATGCNNCEKFTDSICNDLGAADCAIWRATGGPEKVIPGGRGVNSFCGKMLDNETTYQGILLGARGTVLAEKLKKAAAAKDDAKVKALTEELKKHTAKVKAGFAKP